MTWRIGIALLLLLYANSAWAQDDDFCRQHPSECSRSSSGASTTAAPSQGDAASVRQTTEVPLNGRSSAAAQGSMDMSSVAPAPAPQPQSVPVGESMASATAAMMFQQRTGATRALQPARIYLRASQIPIPGVGAYGVVALRGRPTDATRDRLMRLCQAYVTYLPRWDTLPGSVAAADRMATIMPVDDPDASRVKSDDCSYVLDHYDVYGGLSALEDAARQGADVSGVGPFLIGWAPASARGQPDKVVLVYDMSAFVSQDSFDRAFIWWQQKIILDPALWRHGWSVDRIRISVRDFFDRYGQAAMEAIKFVSADGH